MTDTQTTERFDPTEWYEPAPAKPWEVSAWRRETDDYIYELTEHKANQLTKWGAHWMFSVREVDPDVDPLDTFTRIPIELASDQVVQTADMNAVLPPKIGGDDE